MFDSCSQCSQKWCKWSALHSSEERWIMSEKCFVLGLYSCCGTELGVFPSLHLALCSFKENKSSLMVSIGFQLGPPTPTCGCHACSGLKRQLYTNMWSLTLESCSLELNTNSDTAPEFQSLDPWMQSSKEEQGEIRKPSSAISAKK